MASDTQTDPLLSQDATIVLALGRTSLPFATTRSEEAERWLRVLRMHGKVGSALQRLGVGEAPLDTSAQARAPQPRRSRPRRHEETVTRICCRALDLARETAADTVGTVHVLFAVLTVYGPEFDRELYRRGASRDELLAALAREHAEPAEAGRGVDETS